MVENHHLQLQIAVQLLHNEKNFFSLETHRMKSMWILI